MPISAASGKSQPKPGASDASSVLPATSARPAEQHRTGADAVDGETGRELGEPARRVEHAGKRPQRRERHVELRLEQRKERRQRELEEVRHRVRQPDDADDSRIVAERVGGFGIQGRRRQRQSLHYT